jgi:hypothetical protein
MLIYHQYNFYQTSCNFDFFIPLILVKKTFKDLCMTFFVQISSQDINEHSTDKSNSYYNFRFDRSSRFHNTQTLNCLKHRSTLEAGRGGRGQAFRKLSHALQAPNEAGYSTCCLSRLGASSSS